MDGNDGDLPASLRDLSPNEAKKLRSYMKADEWAQTAGLTNLIFTTCIVSRFPQFYWLIFIVKTFYYLPVRFFKWRKTNSELYLLDFCYVATYVTTIWCLLGVANWWSYLQAGVQQAGLSTGMFFRAAFVFANGSLGWSVIIFRNSMVLHSIEHMTSLFVHLGPVALFWCLRWGAGFGVQHLAGWFPHTFDICPGESVASVDSCLAWPKVLGWCDTCPSTWSDFLLYPAVLYMIIWAIPYYLTVFVFFKNYIKEHKKETLFDHLLTDPTMSAFVRKFPEPCWPAAYILQHFLVMVLSGLFTRLFWHNFIAHTAFGMILIFVAVRNGSTYTFRVFGMRYAQNLLDTHAQSIRDLNPSWL